MKKHFLLAFFAFVFLGTANAQIELKVNPVGLLYNRPDVSAEYLVNEDVGVEATIGLLYGKNALKQKQSGFRLTISGKYYFSPDDGGDKFYAGLYLGPRTRKIENFSVFSGIDLDYGYKISAFAAGLLVGYKWVGARGIIFETTVGAGRAFGEKVTWNDPDYDDGIFDGFGVDGIIRVVVGYRLGMK